MGDYCIGLGTPLGFSPIPASDRMRILFWPEKHNNTIPKCPQNGLATAITRYSPFLSISPMTQIVPNPFTACIRVVHVSNKHQYPFWIYTMAFLKWVKKRSCGRKCALFYYSIFYCCLMFFIYGDSASYLLIWDDDLTIVLGWIQTGFKAPARYTDRLWLRSWFIPGFESSHIYSYLISPFFGWFAPGKSAAPLFVATWPSKMPRSGFNPWEGW